MIPAGNARQQVPAAAPLLRPSDIRKELERIFSKDRRSHLAALFGRGEAGEVVARAKTFTVVPTRC